MAFVHKIRQVQLVGPKIRQLRKERKLTQTELASRIGIQQSDLSRMEKGEYRVSLDTLFRILAEFNVSISEFFDDVNKEQMTPRDVQIMRDLKQLPTESRREVEAFIAFKRSQSGPTIASEDEELPKVAEEGRGSGCTWCSERCAEGPGRSERAGCPAGAERSPERPEGAPGSAASSVTAYVETNEVGPRADVARGPVLIPAGPATARAP